MVRGSVGRQPAEELNSALRKSKIKDLAKAAMTAKELGLEHQHIQILRSRGFVRRLKWADKYHRTAVWCAGPEYQKLMQNFERWV